MLSQKLHCHFRSLTPSAARCALAATAAALLLTGCNTLQPAKNGQKPSPYIDVTAVQARDDVYAIHQYWPQYPWISAPGEAITGFKVSTYFVSSETEKGVFVPGRILAWLYQVVAGPDGRPARVLLHTWALTEQEASGFRVRRESVMGYFYGLVMTWPPNVIVEGKTVEVEFAYERTDGKLITAPARRFRVPLGPELPPAVRTTRRPLGQPQEPQEPPMPPGFIRGPTRATPEPK